MINNTCLSINTNCTHLTPSFNMAVVSPVYYIMFTSLTILASVIMFKVIYYFE
ncbi:putative magnesium transporter NIPA [Helianthus annuus]|nr:putative magnesium transporter NIPA [Helianthus annuus]